MTIHRHAPRHRDDAHQELGGEAMPDGEAVLRGRRAEHRARGRIEDRAHRKGGRNANNKACQDEKLGRQPHQERRLMRRARQVVGAGPKNTSRIKRSEYATVNMLARVTM